MSVTYNGAELFGPLAWAPGVEENVVNQNGSSVLYTADTNGAGRQTVVRAEEDIRMALAPTGTLVQIRPLGVTLNASTNGVAHTRRVTLAQGTTQLHDNAGVLQVELKDGTTTLFEGDGATASVTRAAPAGSQWLFAEPVGFSQAGGGVVFLPGSGQQHLREISTGSVELRADDAITLDTNNGGGSSVVTRVAGNARQYAGASSVLFYEQDGTTVSASQLGTGSWGFVRGLTLGTPGTNYTLPNARGTLGQHLESDASGGMSFQTRPNVLVQQTGAQSIPTGTTTAVLFQSELFKTGITHSNVTNSSRLTATKPGKYQVSYDIAWAGNTTGDRLAYIARNGLVGLADPRFGRSQVTATSVNPVALNGSMLLHLDAGDYVEVMVQQTSGGALNVGNANLSFRGEFSAHWVAP